jgi:DNA invertase Pin-like site-specific DNA recombinase
VPGLENARRKGRHPGRSPKLSPQLLAEGKKLRAQGVSWRKIGAELDLDEGTLRKALKKRFFAQSRVRVRGRFV